MGHAKLPKCPHTNEYCYIDIFRAYSTNPNEHCDTCPDYKKNYRTILYNSIKEAERNPKSNIHLIRKELKADGGKYISFGLGDEGLLIGATSTVEDYYWLFLNKDRKLKYFTCVGGYEVLDDVPADMSVVEWLRTHRINELHDVITTQLKNQLHDVLITPIYLREGKPYINHEQKSRNKNIRQKRRSNI